MDKNPSSTDPFAETKYVVKTNTRGTVVTIADELEYGLLEISLEGSDRAAGLTARPYRDREREVLRIVEAEQDAQGLLGRISEFFSHAKTFSVADVAKNEMLGTISVNNIDLHPREQQWMVEQAEPNMAVRISSAGVTEDGLRFELTGVHEDSPVCRYTARDGIGIRSVWADFSMSGPHEFDVRLGLAVAVKVVETMAAAGSGTHGK